MEYESPGVTLITRYHCFVPAIGVGTAAVFIPGPTSVVVQFLNHALFLWGAHCALRISVGQPPKQSLLERLPAQLVFQLFYGLAAILMILIPSGMIAISASTENLTILGLAGLGFLIVSLKLWPAQAMIMGLTHAIDGGKYLSGAGEGAARACRMALSITRGNLEQTLEGLPVILSVLIIGATPVLLYLVKDELSDSGQLSSMATYLLLLAPMIHGYLLISVRRLTGEFEPSVNEPAKPLPTGEQNIIAATQVMSAQSVLNTQVMTVPELVHSDTDIESVATTGIDSALLQAASAGDLERLQALAEQGSDFDDLIAGTTPLIATLKSQQENRLLTVQWLTENGANVDTADDKGDTALHHACRLGDLGAVEFLLMQGPDQKDHQYRQAYGVGRCLWKRMLAGG